MSYANYRRRRVPGAIVYISDLLRFRHLCWNLVGSDLRSRFRRSRLGILWAIIQPLAFSLLIAWAWGTIFNSQSYWEYAVYVFCGMIVWDYFGNTINGSMDALVGSVGYLRQARVPFFIFQARVPFTGFVVFLAGLAGLLAMVLALQLLPPPGWHLLLLVAYPFVLTALFLPLAIIFSILGAQFRDVRHIVSIAMQALFFVSPVMIDRSLFVDDRLAIMQYANPLVPLLDMLRGPLLDGRLWSPQEVFVVGGWWAAMWVVAAVIALRASRKIVFAL